MSRRTALRPNRVFAKSLLIALTAILGASALASEAVAEKKYKKLYVVFVKHPEKQVVWQAFPYESKKAADSRAAKINREHWIKVTPVVGRPFYRDGKDKLVGIQLSSIPDKVLANLTGVHVGKVDPIEKEAVVRVRYEEIK